MGQAKQRGTKEERIAQAAQRKREEAAYAEATKRAHARMAAANERQRVRAEKEKVVLAKSPSYPRHRHVSGNASLSTAMLVAALAGLGGRRYG